VVVEEEGRCVRGAGSRGSGGGMVGILHTFMRPYLCLPFSHISYFNDVYNVLRYYGFRKRRERG
jgi:hypothetical protein